MDSKNVLNSATMWSAVIAVGGVVLSQFGVELGVGVDQQIVAAVGATATAFGALGVIVERWRKGDLYIRKPKVGSG